MNERGKTAKPTSGEKRADQGPGGSRSQGGERGGNGLERTRSWLDRVREPGGAGGGFWSGTAAAEEPARGEWPPEVPPAPLTDEAAEAEREYANWSQSGSPTAPDGAWADGAATEPRARRYDEEELVSGIPEQTPGPALESSVGLSVSRLRAAALEMARRDAESGLPAPETKGRSESEQELRDRCTSLFRDWQARQRDRLNGLVSDKEGRITETLGAVALDVDRFERITTELFRLKKRLDVNRSLVERQLERKESQVEETQDEEEKKSGSRAFKTHWYALAIGFLGIVEFLANAPVFGALLPRDPLTERQIRLVAETSEGWLAGAERVASQFILRPDAALLAAGVVTFLCVLAHFFGHSLRSLLVHRSAQTAGETVANRSAGEYVVPMILAGLGLALVLGVLFEARVTLGEVARDRFAQDSAKVEELRRTASWLRVDGNLVAANEQANRADDLEALAKEQREYAASMSGLSFPILLLNSTLVLVALSAAYFHQRDPRRDRFNEQPWEVQRREMVAAGDHLQERIAEGMGRLVRLIGELKGLLTEKPLKEAPALAHQLDATVVAYRAENGRLRGLDPRELPAFADPVRLELEQDLEPPKLAVKHAEEYEKERLHLVQRFEEARTRFTTEATTW